MASQGGQQLTPEQQQQQQEAQQEADEQRQSMLHAIMQPAARERCASKVCFAADLIWVARLVCACVRAAPMLHMSGSVAPALGRCMS